MEKLEPSIQWYMDAYIKAAKQNGISRQDLLKKISTEPIENICRVTYFSVPNKRNNNRYLTFEEHAEISMHSRESDELGLRAHTDFSDCIYPSIKTFEGVHLYNRDGTPLVCVRSEFISSQHDGLDKAINEWAEAEGINAIEPSADELKRLFSKVIEFYNQDKLLRNYKKLLQT